jgi:hypothetical protein
MYFTLCGIPVVDHKPQQTQQHFPVAANHTFDFTMFQVAPIYNIPGPIGVHLAYKQFIMLL